MIFRYRYRIGKRAWKSATTLGSALRVISNEGMTLVEAGTAQVERSMDEDPWVRIVCINLDGIAKEDING